MLHSDFNRQKMGPFSSKNEHLTIKFIKLSRECPNHPVTYVQFAYCWAFHLPTTCFVFDIFVLFLWFAYFLLWLPIMTVRLFSKDHDAPVRLHECYSIHQHKALYQRQTFHSFHIRSLQVFSDLANRNEISRSNENEAKSQTLRQKLRIKYDCFIRMFYGRYLMSF